MNQLRSQPSDTMEAPRAPSGTRLLWGAPKPRQPVAADDPAHGRLHRVLDGRFELTRVIGRGGMGVVYEAIDRVLERLVVIKVVTPQLADTGAARLIREARVACRVQHPSIVTVFHLGVLDEREPFIVMERLEGADLAVLMADAGPLPLERVVAVVEPIAEALAVLHAEGVVHRDVKPENVFVLGARLERPRVKLIDFGLAILDDRTLARITRQGQVLGTPEYMAPECARGAPATAAADVYALATMAFELLTGELPFVGSGFDLLVAKTEGQPRELSSLRSEPAMRAVSEALARGLSRDPAQRPTASAFMEELRAATLQAGIGEPAVGPASRPDPEPQRDVARASDGAVLSSTRVAWISFAASVLSLIASALALATSS